MPVNVVALQQFGADALRECLRLRRPKRSDFDLTNLHQVSVSIVSNRRMAGLHQRFLNQPGPTDVLTFRHGEIVISAETARSQARIFRSTLRRELQLYLVHGLLHLQGFDDRSPRQSRPMERAQQRILQAVLGLN